MTQFRRNLPLSLLLAVAALAIAAGAGAVWIVYGTRVGPAKPRVPPSELATEAAGDPVDRIGAIDLEVGVIDGAEDLEVMEKEYDCPSCSARSGKIELSVRGERPRILRNSYDDGSHCSFDETYYFTLDGELIHAVTLESCYESDAQPAVERWDETRTYFHGGTAIVSQRRSAGAQEELDGTSWEDDVAPVGDALPRRAYALVDFFNADYDYETFFSGRRP